MQGITYPTTENTIIIWQSVRFYCFKVNAIVLPQSLCVAHSLVTWFSFYWFLFTKTIQSPLNQNCFYFILFSLLTRMRPSQSFCIYLLLYITACTRFPPPSSMSLFYFLVCQCYIDLITTCNQLKQRANLIRILLTHFDRSNIYVCLCLCVLLHS